MVQSLNATNLSLNSLSLTANSDLPARLVWILPGCAPRARTAHTRPARQRVASLTQGRATPPDLSIPCVSYCVFALPQRRWIAKRGVANDVNARSSNAALAQCQSDYAIGGVNRRQGGNGRSRSRREVEERSRERDAYFFFVVFFLEPLPVPELRLDNFTRSYMLQLSNNMRSPVVIRDAIKHSKAVKTWNENFLTKSYGNENVMVCEIAHDSGVRNMSTTTLKEFFYMNKLKGGKKMKIVLL